MTRTTQSRLATSRRACLFVCVVAVIACGCDRAPSPATGTLPANAPPGPAAHAFNAAINAADIAEMVGVLASDGFEGRGPGTRGERKTVDYIRTRFEQIGLQPAFSEGWYQTVPMTITTTQPSTTLRIDIGAQRMPLALGDDVVIGTRAAATRIALTDSALVFAGYGVDAPELGWSDYAGINVRVKTVVVLVNDPGFHSGDATLFEGRRMTWYGRWNYKYEAAARHGAAAVLIVHDTPGASYGWDVVRHSWSGAQYDLRTSDDPAQRLRAQGWISRHTALRLFAASGMDLDAQVRAAGTRGFRARPMGATLSLSLDSTVQLGSSRNVVGMLPGTTRRSEAVVYMAHWDHLGRHVADDRRAGRGALARATSKDEPVDDIYNGAVDNATGVAGMLEIAAAFANASRKPQRSLVFAAVTLEESGLLGSQYLVAHPAFALRDTVGVINIDAMGVSGRSRDMVVVGKGNSGLEDILARVIAAQDRTLVAEGNTAGGFYFRSDHFSFARAGVPALYTDSGDDLRDGGISAGIAASASYNATRYHTPADEVDASWNLDGAVEDLQALYGVGRELVDGSAWPPWSASSPFRPARQRMLREQNADPVTSQPADR